MAHAEAQPLRRRIGQASQPRFLFDRPVQVAFDRLANGTSLGGRLAELADRSVLLAASGQLAAALALIELDGVARRITILPPDVDPDHLAALRATAEADAVVVDAGTARHPALDLPLRVAVSPDI